MRFLKILLLFLLIYGDIVGADEKSHKGEDPVVFMYHRFGEKTFPSTNIRMEQFEFQMKYLKDNSYTVWPLSKIINALVEHKEIPQKTVALTMDDAYISVYTRAYPILKKYDFPFTVFVNSQPIDRHYKNYMSWDQMKEMASHGAEFADHTYTHAYLLQGKHESKDAWQKRVSDEILIAQKEIQEHLGENTNTAVKMLCYPFGEYSQDVIDLVKSLGYYGVAQTPGPLSEQVDLMQIPRFPMSEKYATKEGFLLKLHTKAFDIGKIIPLEPMVSSQNPPVLTLTFSTPIKNINCYSANGEKIEAKWISENELQVKAKSALKPPRDHYTCTAKKDGDWYWYSHIWIIK